MRWSEVSGGAGGLEDSCTKLVLRDLTVSGRRTNLLPQESIGELCCFLVLHQNRWQHIQLAVRREVISLVKWVAWQGGWN